MAHLFFLLVRLVFLFIFIFLFLQPISTQIFNSPIIPTPIDSTPSPSPSPTPTPTPSPSPDPTPSTPSVVSPSSSPPPSTPTTPSGSNSPSPLSPNSSPSSSPSRSAVSTSSSSASPLSGPSSPKQSQSSTIIIITITTTGADGVIYTSLASSYTPLPHPTSSPSNNDSGSSSSTWAIIGGVVGGLAGIAAVVFIVFRCTQQRFSDLDDEDVPIKWPELVNRTDDATTLNPLAARPGIGHGIGEDDENDEKPRLYPHDIAMEPLHSDQRHPGIYDPYQTYHPPMHPQDHQTYLDDPYLGPSGVQQPYPASVNNLGYDEMGYHQARSHELQAHPSHNSSITMAGGRRDMNSPSASYRAPPRQRDHVNHNDQFHDDSAYWDGPDNIPLSVVNSAGPVPKNSHQQHD